MTHFSAFSLLKQALNGHKGWREQWPDSPPKAVVDLDKEAPPREVVTETGESGGIMAALDTVGRAALDDLVFDTGSSALSDGEYASLAEVAAWLALCPEAPSPATIAQPSLVVS